MPEGWRSRGVTPCPRSGAVAGRSYPAFEPGVAAERSYPTSEVRGRSREDPMAEGWRPRGVTPCPRSGAVADSARLQQCRNGLKELPRI